MGVRRQKITAVEPRMPGQDQEARGSGGADRQAVEGHGRVESRRNAGGGAHGVGASMKLFIAAPSSWALAAVSERRSPSPPRPPQPHPRGQEYHALTPCRSQIQLWRQGKGAGKGVTHLIPTSLPAQSRGRPDMGKREARFSLGVNG